MPGQRRPGLSLLHPSLRDHPPGDGKRPRQGAQVNLGTHALFSRKSVKLKKINKIKRWGPGYTGKTDEDPMTLLRDVIEAEEIRLDR